MLLLLLSEPKAWQAAAPPWAPLVPGSLPQWGLGAALITFLAVLLGALLRPSLYPAVPGPPYTPLLGNLLEFLFKGANKVFSDWSQAYGRVFRFRMGLKEILVVADAELVKEVTVKKFKAFRNRAGPDELQKEVTLGIVLGRDKYWSTARGASLAWFHNREHLQGYLGFMGQLLQGVCQELASLEPEQTVDIHLRLQTLTLDVFSCAAFGGTLDSSVDTKASEVAALVSQVTRDLSVPTLSSVLALFLPVRASKALNWALSLVPGTPERSRAANLRRRTFLGDQLMQARLQELDKGEARQDVLTQLLRTQEQSQMPLTKHQILFIIGELIVAGSDTTSNSVAFSIFLLATHPEAEARLVAEIRRLQGDSPPDSVENLDKYQYCLMVVKETLRLYPTGAQLFREAAEDTTVGSIRVPKGGQVLFPLLLLHRDPSYFPDPNAFVPERFDPESPLSAGNNMTAYIPFGSGPRMCLGYKFALQEASLALIQLYSSYSFKMPPSFGGLTGKEAIAALPIDTGIIVKPRDGLHVQVVKRVEKHRQ